MSRQAILGELPVNDNSDQTDKGRRLNFSCATPDKVAAHLKLEDALGGEPIRIPLTRKMTPVRNENIPEEWATMLTPARFCRKLNIDVQPHHPRDAKPKKFTRLNNDNWLYIYVNGCLWRELQIERHRGSAYYKDVNLLIYETQEKQDIRIASGQRVNRVVLPIKLENKEVTVEVAYSDIQWSWARVQSMGGIAPEGVKRKDWFPDEHPVNPKGKTLRKDRMQTLPLLKGYANAFSQTVGDVMPMEDCNLYEFKRDYGKKFPFIALTNYLEDAKDLAFSYQQSWRNLEDYIKELSDPENVKKHEYAPWFDTAVLANQYFFAEQTKIKADNLSNQPGKPNAENEWVKAQDQRDKWKSNLSLTDIQTALGTKKRAELREKIVKAKKTLVAYLDDSAPYIKQLTAAIDDYCTLPGYAAKSKNSSDPHSGLRYELGDALIARLADHEFILDHYLETKTLSQKQLYEKQVEDPGYKLLAKLVTGQHSFSDRFFIAQEAMQTTASNNSNANQDDADPVITAEKMAIVGRRSAQFVSGFISHFAKVAINKQFKGVQQSIVTLVSISGLGLDNLKRINISAEEYLSGKLTGANADKYELLRVVVKEADEKIKSRAGSKFEGDKAELKVGLSSELNIINRDGVVVGSTTAQAFNQGKGFSRKFMKKKGKKLNWRKQTLEVWVVEKSKGMHAIAKQAMDKGVWSKGILPAVGLFEAWNLYSYFDIFLKAKNTREGLEQARLELGSALVDFAAITATIYEGQLAYKHRLAEKFAGEKLLMSTTQLGAIKFARGFGTGAGAFSAYLSYDAMILNIYQGDDAAIAHGMMTGGFIMVTVSEIIGVAVAFGALGSGSTAAIIASLAGPVGWVGLAVVLVGAALLVWVFKEDTPFEQWLTNSPFSMTPIKSGRKMIESRNGVTYNVFFHDGFTFYFKPDTNILVNYVRRSPARVTTVRADGTVWMMKNKKPVQVAERGKHFNPENFQSREQRFAGNDGRGDNTDKFSIWKKFPTSCYDALVGFIYQPAASLKLIRIGSSCDYYYNMELNVQVPNYIENRTLLFIEVWQKEFSKWQRVLGGFDLVTGDGSGPRSVQVRRYMSTSKWVKAYIWLDLYGDGNVVLPRGEPQLISAQFDAVSGPGATAMKPYTMSVQRLEVTPEIKVISTE